MNLNSRDSQLQLKPVLHGLFCVFVLAKQVTRDYDEEEQGYDSEKEKKDEKASDATSPKFKESPEKGGGEPRESKVNGDDHHEEDMDMSD